MIIRRIIGCRFGATNNHFNHYWLGNKKYYTQMHQNLPENLNKLQRAIVKFNDEDDRISLSLPFKYKELKSKVFNFNRLSTEKMEQMTSVVEEKILKVINMKLKKKNIVVHNLDIQFLKKSQIIDKISLNIDKSCLHKINTNKSCLDILVTEGEEHIINIEQSYYYLDINPPQIETIKLPSDIRTGCYVYPEIQLKNASLQDSKYTWFISENKYSDHNLIKNKIKWNSIHEGFLLKTDEDTEGRLLKLVIEPCNGDRTGDAKEAIAPTLISQRPEDCPYKLRHEYTKEYTPHDRLRIVSYNLLADTYARTKFSAEHLFPTCPTYALQMDYRKQLLIDEILGYKGDILCLQEVDRDFFRDDLSRVLNLGSDGRLQGNFAAKDKGVGPEGVSTFYNTEKFKLLKHENLYLSEELSNNPVLSQLRSSLESSNKELLQLLMDRTTVLQVSTLHRVSPDDEKEVVIAGNSHFYFHPEANLVRLVHAVMCNLLLQQRVQEQQTQGYRSSVLFCGDLNSMPESAVVKFFTLKTVTTDLQITNEVHNVLKTLDQSETPRFSSACGTPQFTNYAVTFNGCLDWIFYQPDNMTVMKVLDLPTLEQVTEHTALPSPKIPSDHLALVAELSFTPLSKPQMSWKKLKTKFGIS